MITTSEILQTLQMIDHQKLDVRTITMGISLLSCVSDDESALCVRVYDRITRQAENLVKVGRAIESEFGVPIVNKRISVTPVALITGAIRHPAKVAQALDKAARETGVDFIGGYSALVHKGITAADRRLIESIPEALSATEYLCSSVNVGSTRAGIDMDAVRMMGDVIKQTAARTADKSGLGCAKLVVFCNAVEDNPFMAGAFHGIGESDCAINVGVSGPGVVKVALEGMRGRPFDEVAETIKRTAFHITRVGQLVALEASRRLNVPFGIVDLSLAPTPAIGDSGWRFRDRHLGGNGPGNLRRAWHHRRAGPAQRRGEEGRRHGVFARGRPVRRVHSGQRRYRHDSGGGKGRAFAGKARSHDLRLLRGAGYDRHSRRHSRRNHRGHHRGRSRHRHGQWQNHRRARHPRAGHPDGRPRGIRRPAGACAGHPGAPAKRRRLYPPGRPHSRAAA